MNEHPEQGEPGEQNQPGEHSQPGEQNEQPELRDQLAPSEGLVADSHAAETAQDVPHNLGAVSTPSTDDVVPASDTTPSVGEQALSDQSPSAEQPGATPPFDMGSQYSTPQAPPLSPPQYGERTAGESSFAPPSANPESAAAAKKSSRNSSGIPRSGLLVAGIAIGALIGGIAGAGVSALTIGQIGMGNAGAYARDSITIANAEDATIVSGIAAKATPSVVTLEVFASNGAGTGSGVIIDPSGYILTNNHVVSLDSGRDDATIRVFLSDGRILSGTLVGTDPYSDLAVVKVEAEGLPAIEFANSEKLNVGDLTVAIGAPLNLANTVTTGVISALYRGITVGSAEVEDVPENDQPTDPEDLWNFEFEQQPNTAASGSITIPVIQTDASINPGNSGGALLNANGDLIGINVAIASTSSTAETAGSVGLGFAIPSNLAKRVSESLIAGEKASHGKLGVSVGDASGSEDAVQSGALIQDVSPGSPAAKAGLQSGDIIISLNGVPVMDGTSLSGLVRYYPAGADVSVEYIRGDTVNTTNVILGSL